MSRHRRIATAGRVVAALRPKGPRGFPLCRWCNRECPSARHTFCSPPCVHEHRIRSDPKYVRLCLFQRDKGVCAVCRLDTVALLAALMQLKPRARSAKAKALGIPYHRVKSGSLWDADHLVPVALGGGECGLPGYQTLCCGCHKLKSAAQAKRTQHEGRKAAEAAPAEAPAPDPAKKPRRPRRPRKPKTTVA